MVYPIEKCLWLALLAVFVVSAAPTPVEGVCAPPSSNLVTKANENAVGITNLLQSEADSTSPFAIFGGGVSPFGSITSTYGKNGLQLTPANDPSDNESNSSATLDSGSSSKAAESNSFSVILV